MFDLHAVFGFDKDLANKGAKMPLGSDPEEYIQLKKSTNNADYRAMLNKEYRAAESALANPDVSVQNSIGDDIMAKVLAHTVVVGWGKKFAIKGKVVPFSPEKCTEVFKEYPEFRQKCAAYAEDLKNFQEVAEVSAEAVKK